MRVQMLSKRRVVCTKDEGCGFKSPLLKTRGMITALKPNGNYMYHLL
jgi:hypothetical protein